MPPLALLPGQPIGSPDITSWGYGAGMGPATPAHTGTGVRDNSGRELTPEELRRWDEYVALTRKATDQAAGWERAKARLQYEDAEKGRANAYKIAELSAQTSRYGVDRQTDVSLRQLKEDQRQFDQRHGLEMARFGLDERRFGLDAANAYTQYASTPDRYFMLGDFQQAMGRLGQGGGPQPYGATGQPRAKGWEDFAALAGFGQMPAVQSGQSGATMQATGMGQQQAGDPRVRAAQGILKAIPISDGQGMDDDDFAALNAIENVFRASRPGTLERMTPGQRGMFSGGLARLGYNAPDALEQLRRSGIGYGSARSA